MVNNSTQYRDILNQLQTLANPVNVAGMARFGINPQNTVGISVAVLRPLAKAVGKNQELSLKLWQSQIHEARILAAYIGAPSQVSEEQMERWAADFDSWDICDQCCSNLFARNPLAWEKALDWSGRDEEFVKRAGFVLMASLAVKDKQAANRDFEPFLEAILSGAPDKRNFVKKAVNWALRQIGKRNAELNARAQATARHIQQFNSPGARWIAADALRELSGANVQSRLKQLARRPQG
jgi:3-methyladenine DNA glycosylase AlkD